MLGAFAWRYSCVLESHLPEFLEARSGCDHETGTKPVDVGSAPGGIWQSGGVQKDPARVICVMPGFSTDYRSRLHGCLSRDPGVANPGGGHDHASIRLVWSCFLVLRN